MDRQLRFDLGRGPQTDIFLDLIERLAVAAEEEGRTAEERRYISDLISTLWDLYRIL